MLFTLLLLAFILNRSLSAADLRLAVDAADIWPANWYAEFCTEVQLPSSFDLMNNGCSMLWPLSQPPKLILSQCPIFGKRVRRTVPFSPINGVDGTLFMPAIGRSMPFAVAVICTDCVERFKLFIAFILFSMIFIVFCMAAVLPFALAMAGYGGSIAGMKGPFRAFVGLVPTAAVAAVGWMLGAEWMPLLLPFG